MSYWSLRIWSSFFSFLSFFYSFIIKDTDQEQTSEEIYLALYISSRGMIQSFHTFSFVEPGHATIPAHQCVQILLGLQFCRRNYLNQLNSIFSSPPLPEGQAGLNIQSSNHTVHLSGD